MPLLVPPPTASESDLQGLPPDALLASLKQEMSNWMKLYESNQEMATMVQQTKAGQENNEGIKLQPDDVEELEKACQENLEVIERKGILIEKMKNVLVEKVGEHGIPAEVQQAEDKLKAMLQEDSSQGIEL